MKLLFCAVAIALIGLNLTQQSKVTVVKYKDGSGTSELEYNDSVDTEDDIIIEPGSGSDLPADRQTNYEKTTPVVAQREMSRNSLHHLEEVVTEQNKLLVELKSQVSFLTDKINSQQQTIDHMSDQLEDHGWGIADMVQKHLRSTNDITVLKNSLFSLSSSVVQDKPDQRETRYESMKYDMKTLKDQVKLVEKTQTTFGQLLRHVLSDKLWKKTVGEEQYNAAPNIVKDERNTKPIQEETTTTSNFITSTSDIHTSISDEELGLQLVEETTNKIERSFQRWLAVEKVLHVSLGEMYGDHLRYDRELLSLRNYTLNNGAVIEELGLASMAGTTSLLKLMNVSNYLEQQLVRLQQTVYDNRNYSEVAWNDIEISLAQLLQLVEINSEKGETLQQSLEALDSKYKSAIKDSVNKLSNLDVKYDDLSQNVNSTYISLLEKTGRNKEKTDMIWSRIRVIDNRLAQVEVKYLTEELVKYKKSNEDLQQSIQIMKLDDDLESLDKTLDIQHKNYENLSSRLAKLDGKLAAQVKDINEFKDSQIKLFKKLPLLENFYETLKLMVEILPTDCNAVHSRGIQVSGVHLIKMSSQEELTRVLCEMDYNKGWTVVQQRSNGKLSFNRTWSEYKDGFGSVEPHQEFWLGNERLHRLTRSSNYSLRFDIWTTDDVYYYAEYKNFKVLSEERAYRLEVSGYSGNATDSLRHSDGMGFSTVDVDNDSSSTHCAKFYTAGWWYRHCHYCNLNGRYTVGVIWFNHDLDEWMELSTTRMMITRLQ